MVSGQGSDTAFAKALLERAYPAATTADGQQDADPVRTRILDAAGEQFRRWGVQRSTMEDVARLAGVSRVTVYRRFASKDDLVEQVIVREFGRYFDRFLIEVAEANTPGERVVRGFVGSLRALRANPLIGTMIGVDADRLDPSHIGRPGHMIAVVREFVVLQLAREQRAGAICPDVRIDMVAEVMVRICASFLAIPSQVVDIDDDEQLAMLARDFLVPMLLPGNDSERTQRA
ncbi:TetR/AcrR family transcriptional regulator [Nocardia sp. NPDC055321]